MKVVIISPVNHDGTAYVEGDKPDLPQKAAETLIAAGAAIASRRNPAPSATDGEGADQRSTERAE